MAGEGTKSFCTIITLESNGSLYLKATHLCPAGESLVNCNPPRRRKRKKCLPLKWRDWGQCVCVNNCMYWVCESVCSWCFSFLNLLPNCCPRMHYVYWLLFHCAYILPKRAYLRSHTLMFLYLHVSGLLDAACVSSIAFSFASGFGGWWNGRIER